MFMIKSRLCHILATFLFVKELFTVGDIVGKDMYKELKLSLNHNTERLEDISALLKDNTKKLNKNSLVLLNLFDICSVPFTYHAFCFA